MKHYLFVGAGSAMAHATRDKLKSKGEQVIGISRSLQPDYHHCHVVANYQEGLLPDIAEPLDGLVYFPGSIQLKPFHRLSDADILNDLHIHTLGAVAALRKYYPNLKKGEKPSAVLISSVAASVGMPFHASVSMAKAALEGLTLSLAAEWAPTIRVNAVAPSLTSTPMSDRLLNSPEKITAAQQRHPLKQVGQTTDLANAITFLLSEESAWITGQILGVDGGMGNIRLA